MEWLWATVHWIGVRNLAPLVALVPGYASVHIAGPPRFAASGPRVALTFDDAVGQNSTGTTQLLDLLAEHGVQATFFVIANDEYTLGAGKPDILRRLADSGHEVGNHGLEDWSMVGDGEEAFSEWERRVGPVLGHWPRQMGDRKWFRPPKARMSGGLAAAIGQQGYRSVLADVYSDDWLIQDTEFHVRVIQSLVQDGSIIVLHVPDRPHRMHTLEIVRQVIPFLSARGFAFVQLSELFSTGTPGAAPRCEGTAFLVGAAVAIFALLLLRHEQDGSGVSLPGEAEEAASSGSELDAGYATGGDGRCTLLASGRYAPLKSIPQKRGEIGPDAA